MNLINLNRDIQEQILEEIWHELVNFSMSEGLCSCGQSIFGKDSFDRHCNVNNRDFINNKDDYFFLLKVLRYIKGWEDILKDNFLGDLINITELICNNHRCCELIHDKMCNKPKSE